MGTEFTGMGLAGPPDRNIGRQGRYGENERQTKGRVLVVVDASAKGTNDNNWSCEKIKFLGPGFTTSITLSRSYLKWKVEKKRKY